MDQSKINESYDRLKKRYESRAYWRNHLAQEVAKGNISPGTRKERLETDLQATVSTVVSDARLPTRGDQRELRSKLLAKIREEILKEASSVAT